MRTRDDDDRCEIFIGDIASTDETEEDAMCSRGCTRKLTCSMENGVREGRTEGHVEDARVLGPPSKENR